MIFTAAALVLLVFSHYAVVACLIGKLDCGPSAGCFIIVVVFWCATGAAFARRAKVKEGVHEPLNPAAVC